MNNDVAPGLSSKRRRATGLGPYFFSFLIIIIPATATYYFHLQNQESYHQKRSFRALDEAGRLLDRNISAFMKLQSKTKAYDLSLRNNSIFTDIEFEREPTESGGGGSEIKLDPLELVIVDGNIKLTHQFVEKAEGKSKGAIVRSQVSLEYLLSDLRRRREFDVIAFALPDGGVMYSTETERSDFFSGRLDKQPISRVKRYSSVEYLLKLASCKLQENNNKSKVGVPCDNDIGLGQAAFVEVDVGDTTKLVFIQPYLPQQENIFCYLKGESCGAGKLNQGAGYIVGVVDVGRFDARVQRIPPNIVAAIVLVTLIVLLLAPYFRIALGGPLSSVSQLFSGVLLSAGVLSAGVAVILILWATLGRSILEAGEYTARQLSVNIEEDVRGELIERLSIYKSLRNEVSMHYKNKSWGGGFSAEPRNKAIGVEDITPPSCREKTIKYRPPYRVMFFVDNDGESIDGKSIDGENEKYNCKYFFDYRSSPLKNVDIAKRKYFKDAKRNSLDLFSFYEKDTLPSFAIERIMSYSTGSPSLAMAIPESGIGSLSLLDRARVGVISGPLQSLAAPVLPVGFHFAIIEDETGLVIAHDNAGRVLVEDFFRESDDNPELRAAVKRRQDKIIHGKYHGLQSLFHSRPIRDIPWSVVVIQDKSLVQMARFEIAAIALGELFLIFMVIGVCIFSTVIFWRRLPWTWLWPMRRKIFDDHPSVFYAALFALPFAIFVGIVVILTLSGFGLVIGVVITMLCGANLMYQVSVQPLDVALLQVRQWRTPALILLVSILLVIILGVLFGSFIDNIAPQLLTGPFQLCMALLLVLIALTVGSPWLMRKLWDVSVDKNMGKPILCESLRRSRHITAGVLCLLMFGGLPAGAAFKDAYETYMDLLFRHSAIDAALALDRRRGELRRYIGSLEKNGSIQNAPARTASSDFFLDAPYRGVFSGEYLLTVMSESRSKKRLSYAVGEACPTEIKKSKNSGLAAFIVDKVSSIDERMARLHLAGAQRAGDGQWCWGDESSSVEALHYLTKNGLPGNGTSNWMVLALNSENFHQYSSFHIIIFLLLMPPYFGILYFQVGITGARLGGTRIPFILHRSGMRRFNGGKLDFGHLFFKHRLMLRASDRHIYSKAPIVPSATCQMLKLDTASEHDFFQLQRLLDTDLNVEVKVLCLGTLVGDEVQRRKVLPLLESLIKENIDTKITLYADFNPLYRLTRPDAYRDNTSADSGVMRDIESLRWSSLLSKFPKEYAWTPRDNPGWLDWKEESREGNSVCARELRIFHPESKMAALFKQKFFSARQERLYGPNDDIPAEDIIALASELGGAYYRKLWEECTHNERVILQALAAGRCVNTLNIEIISHLMRRGLVVMEPSLSLVNDSFAGFIREAETPETFRHWQQDEQEKGAWQALKVPFIFLLFVPIAILLVVATEELSGGIALMAPILTVIPMLMKGFGLRSA
ncbi:hypothetical protein A9Q88_10105 [Gammaproteobacteria bacterium 50_400_T64]|nr:hypothetical protein A9Q88_10105 [Gammaproteobacteria bacterium 50_400_T64]